MSAIVSGVALGDFSATVKSIKQSSRAQNHKTIPISMMTMTIILVIINILGPNNFDQHQLLFSLRKSWCDKGWLASGTSSSSVIVPYICLSRLLVDNMKLNIIKSFPVLLYVGLLASFSLNVTLLLRKPLPPTMSTDNHGKK